MIQRNYLVLYLYLAIAGLLLAAIAPRPSDGQETGQRSASDQIDGQGATASGANDTSSQLSQLLTKIERLEQKVDKLSAAPSEFSRVTVRVVDPQGRPQQGYEVKLESKGEVRRATARGVSDADGLALDRQLPYGDYTLHASNDRWRYSARVRDVTIEVGSPLELNIVAPAAEETCEIRLSCNLSIDDFRGLPFGEHWVVEERTSHTHAAPEPGESTDDWQTFPTVGDGIERVAAKVQLAVSQVVEQPNGDKWTWKWDDAEGEDLSSKAYLVSSESIHVMKDNRRNQMTRIEQKADYFSKLIKDSDDWQERRECLGYAPLTLEQGQQPPTTITLPAGVIDVEIVDLYGRPTPAVVEIIAANESKNNKSLQAADEIWLEASIHDSSEWWQQALDETWGDKAETQVELGPGETQTIVVGHQAD
ncbi:carboxypeptidase-like regulatory domain-containing protein [Aeoliella sp. ICT_H6.2]|uniref:Carboxypeptidase-like regulatory domain-containing protein n=1 Tax=Aeoliella straminimaris TaxID=2954799 RepID=A0A9X2F999_9BACT|nr:carboxypeptidase-like regulatory domain-containing protein [Aeoliella straminimaris]MCO6044013.1 carboxypeptidase-like regulatory domain-containing protein [Aeoliella straminimaris]